MAVTTMRRAALCIHLLDENKIGKSPAEAKIFHLLGQTSLSHSLWIKPTDALNSKFIGITTLYVSGSLSAHHQEFVAVHRHWYILCSFDDRLLPRAAAPGSKRSSKMHKMYQCRCAGTNPCWWAERLPETCRVV